MSAVEEPQSNGHITESVEERDLTPDTGINDEDMGDDDGDLFGDDDDEDQELGDTEPIQRKLDDSELDSGDDEERTDRVEATIEDEDMQDRPEQLLSADVARINFPESEDLYMLNMPDFLALKHRNFDYNSYEAPTVPHDGDEERKFSPFSAAMTSMFWRRDPKTPELLQSNARIVRWSDGSLTLQLATKPTEHYRVETKAVRQSFAAKQKRQAPPTHYDPSKDSHMFLAASHATAGVDLQLVQPIDATMKILPTGDHLDESILRLKQSLAAVKETHDPLARLKTVEEDPEHAKKAAEAFEKDKARALRKREAAEDRLVSRRERVLGTRGMGGGYGRSAGLSVAGLEADDDGMPTTKSSKVKRRDKIPPGNRRGDIYSDDEDPSLPRHRTREDEYDREDDFLADSDEEPEMYDDGEEEVVGDDSDDDPDKDDLEIEGRQTILDDRTRGKASNASKPTKRSRMDEIEADDDDDAEGEEDTDFLKAQAGGGRKRRVIDDDEDEDE